MKRRVTLGCTCLGAMMLAGGAQAGVLIDDFNEGDGVVSSNVDIGPLNVVAATSAIGGSRTLSILGFPGDGDATSTGVDLQSNSAVGELGHSQNAFSPGGRSRVTWDNNGDGLGGVDLTDGGIDDSFMFDIVRIDIGNVDIEIEVVSDAHGTATIENNNLVESENFVLYTDFDGYSEDIFTSVDLISMTITAGSASDLTIDIYETADIVPPVPPIPEPATAGLLAGLGILGLGRRKR